MKVLYCASEVAPIIKVGGLGDVAGSLPKALAKLGVEMSIVVPRYGNIDIRNYGISKLGETKILFAGRQEQVIVWQTKLPGSEIPVYLLENETYLSKGSHQAFAGTEKEIERFAFFSKAIAELILHTRRVYHERSSPGGCASFDLLHLNDWHTSLVPLLLTGNCKLPTLLTIHNLSYQGISGLDLLKKVGLNPDDCRVLKWDCQNRDIDILMEGIIHTDFVNTVSPTYAKEIMTPEYGNGIEEVLKAKEGRVLGILNGIDDEVWNPETDQLISKQYTVNSVQSGKDENKKFLQKELGLPVNENIPLLAYIGRIEPKQKGLDILYEAMEKLLPENNFQFVLLGTGDKEWEKVYSLQSTVYSQNMRFINRFDEKLAHQIYAGADIILVPSKFEPCGLPQMIAMRYGALPLVRKTGGLADTVVDGKTGFVFEDYSGETLIDKIREALAKFQIPIRQLADKFQMIETAMREDFSWGKSAKEYLELYKKILQINTDTTNTYQ